MIKRKGWKMFHSVLAMHFTSAVEKKRLLQCLLGCACILFYSLNSYTLEYSTYLGGDSWDQANAVAVNNDGNVVVVGWTEGPTFPTTTGAYDESHNGDKDVFVMVLTPDLTTLLYSTLIGGDNDDRPLDIQVDSSGDLVICGYTYSEEFPTTQGAYDREFDNPSSADPDAFVFKIPSTLNVLHASTFIGGDDWDIARDILINQDGDIVVSGDTGSEDFPVTPFAYDTEIDAHPATIFKLSNDLSTLIASTFVEGNYGYHETAGIVEEEDGNFVLAGYTNATDFPTSPGAYDDTLHGHYNIVVFRLSADLSDLLHATYIGGSGYDYASGIALGRDGNIVVFGDTTSPDYPSTAGAYDPTYNWNGISARPDLVISMFSYDMSTLVASTFLGGSSGYDHSDAIDILDSGKIVVIAHTDDAGFPTTLDAFDTGFNGFIDVVVSLLSADLSELHYSTFLGGGGWDAPRRLTVSHPNGCYVVGFAYPHFPTTEGAYDRENTFIDGFLLKFGFPDDVFPCLVTGPGPGEDNPPFVRTSTGEWQAYGVAKYGVNVACGDLDGDGNDEIITGPGPGAVFGPHVRGWTSGGVALPNVSFLAYGTHKYGVNVSAGDVDGDGIDEIITGAGPGAVFGPHVRGWNVDGGSAIPIAGVSYFAYGTLRWGVNVAGGDIDGDGFDEIVTGAGPGTVFGPHVRGWNYDGAGPLAPIPAVSYLAYGTNQWGVNVACGDLDGDGREEIVTGAGPGVVFGSHVRGWKYDGSSISPMPTVSFFAYPEARYGVVVGACDVDGDGVDEILTMPGPDPAQTAHARAWNVDGGQVTAIEAIDFYPYSDEWRYGGRIAGGRFE